eukprot:5781493-Lingulodinium_polyedra.AAC.1
MSLAESRPPGAKRAATSLRARELGVRSKMSCLQEKMLRGDPLRALDIPAHSHAHENGAGARRGLA